MRWHDPFNAPYGSGKIFAMNDDNQIGTSGLRGTFAIAGHRTQQMACDSVPDLVAALVDQIKSMIRSDAPPGSDSQR